MIFIAGSSFLNGEAEFLTIVTSSKYNKSEPESVECMRQVSYKNGFSVLC